MILLLLASLASQDLPALCSQYSERCLYAPSSSFRFGVSSQVFAYNDVASERRSLTLAVRVPAVPAGTRMPLVIWSPEAFSNPTDAESILQKWSELTASAGYLTLTVTHPERTDAQKTALCKALEIEDCAAFSDVNWDRAQDLVRVVAAAEAFNESGPAEIRGRIDLDRIAVAGFDQGANAAASLAGATRMIRPTATRARPDAFVSGRPVAFVLLSPSSAGIEGFYDYDINQPRHSWMGVVRPVLTITGRGDNNCVFPGSCFEGDSPARRAGTFDFHPAGGKSLLSLSTVEVNHDFYGSIDVDACTAKGTEPAHCALQADLLKSTVMAFLDGQVRNVPAAMAWIRNDLVVPASGRTVTWRKK